LSYDFLGYHLESRSRSVLDRRDLALLVGESNKYIIRVDMNIWIKSKFKCLSLEMNIIGRLFLFILIYKPPSASFGDFQHFFES